MEKSSSQYHSENYWNRLHSNYQGSLKAVGQTGLSLAYNDAKYRSENATFINLVSAIPVQPETVLELGVGTGFWTQQMFNLWGHSIKVTGIDVSGLAIEDLGNRLPEVRGIVGNLGTMSADSFSGQFDCVTAIMVFLHITDDSQFLNALRLAARSVKKGGTLVIYEPMLSRNASPFRNPGYGSAHNTLRERLTFDSQLKIEGLRCIKKIDGSTWLLNSPIEANSMIFYGLMNAVWFFLSSSVYRLNRFMKVLTPALLKIDMFFKEKMLGRSGTFTLYQKSEK